MKRAMECQSVSLSLSLIVFLALFLQTGAHSPLANIQQRAQNQNKVKLTHSPLPIGHIQQRAQNQNKVKLTHSPLPIGHIQQRAQNQNKLHLTHRPLAIIKQRAKNKKLKKIKLTHKSHMHAHKHTNSLKRFDLGDVLKDETESVSDDLTLQRREC